MTTLGLTSAQYNAAVAVFYIFCGLAGVPANIIIKKVSPGVWFASLTMFWGFIMITQGLVHSHQGLIASRCFLGLAEGGLFPGVAWYFTTWYSRYQSGLRIAIFFSAAPIAGAIGGFFAHGINFTEGAKGRHMWAWLFIIQGIITLCVGLVAYVLGNNSPTT